MTTKPRYLKWIWATHLLFWLLLAFLLVLVFEAVLQTREQVFTASAVNLAGFGLLVYGHLFFLLPRYFDRKNYLRYGIGLLLLLLLTTMLRFLVGKELVAELELGIDSVFTPQYFGSMMVGGTFFLLISIPLRLIDNWFKKRELEKELKTHQLEAELRFLKAQVNPHFLFNALNNIYALSFTESKKTPEMILKLSDMMSYMLYECKSEKVKLTSEIAYLENYIALQQLKKDGEFNIKFDISGDVSNVYITPMLFIPFFENAFKHGNLEDTGNAWLESTLRMENGNLYFRIANTMRNENIETQKGGVGLENIRKRLRFLFPQKHELKIEKKENIFSVNLKINLTKP